MAAIFLNYQGGDVFLKNVQFSIPYGVAQLESLWANGSNTIVTDVSVQTAELLQHFTGFDDLITTLHFGKAIGAISISGIMFSSCDGSVAGIKKFYQVVGPQRGKPVTVSLGGAAFQGIVSDTSVQLTANPDTMAYFTIRMNLVNHSLPGVVDNAYDGFGLNPAGGALGFSGSSGGGLGRR